VQFDLGLSRIPEDEVALGPILTKEAIEKGEMMDYSTLSFSFTFLKYFCFNN
jgi:hypothetical protein